jgi:Protein of unknown function (DUF2950)
MIDFADNPATSCMQRLLLAASLVALLPIGGCHKQPSAPAGPQTFASPQDAGNALENAAKSQDMNQILVIFGPEAKDLLASGDETENKAALSAFSQAYQVMNRWRKLGDGGQLLIVGYDNQTFPVPLMKNAAGQWHFDTAAGKEEMLSRRIGRNELTTIDVCAAIADAQAQYFSQKHGGVRQYASKFISDPGQQNGLYWDPSQGTPRSPLGPMIVYASAEGYKIKPDQHQPFHGYYYVLLTGQGPGAIGGAKSYLVNGKMTGGYAVVAYPANYGDSGIMTFMFNQDGPLIQKDLGKSTDKVASAITEFDPDKSWTVVEE